MAHFRSTHDRFVGVVYHIIIDTMQIVVVRKREYKIISSTERADLGTCITRAHGEVRIKSSIVWLFIGVVSSVWLFAQYGKHHDEESHEATHNK